MIWTEITLRARQKCNHVVRSVSNNRTKWNEDWGKQLGGSKQCCKPTNRFSALNLIADLPTTLLDSMHRISEAAACIISRAIERPPSVSSIPFRTCTPPNSCTLTCKYLLATKGQSSQKPKVSQRKAKRAEQHTKADGEEIHLFIKWNLNNKLPEEQCDILGLGKELQL